MAVETLSNITQDEIEYARMTTLIKSQLDYQSGMVNAKRSGIKEGREEILELFEQGLSLDEIKERIQQETD